MSKPTRKNPLHGNYLSNAAGGPSEPFLVWTHQGQWFARLPFGTYAELVAGPAMTQESAEENLCRALDTIRGSKP